MNPVTAVGLAASVAQFVSFACSIAKASAEILEHGTLEKIRELSDVTKSLRQWTSVLKLDIQNAPDPTLVVTLKGCCEIAEKMVLSLEKAEAKQGKQQSGSYALANWLQIA